MTTKFTELTEIAAVDVADDDVLALSDVSESASRKVTVASLRNELSQVQVEDGTSTVFGAVSGERLGQFISARFSESTPAALSADTTFTFAHGLGVSPKIVTIEIIAQSAVNGFDSGDVVVLANTGTFMDGADFGHMVRVDATNVRLTIGVQMVIVAPNFNRVSLTLGSWNYRIRAFA